MTTIERTDSTPLTTAGRDRAPEAPATHSQMEARMSRHSIAPGRVAVLDLADYGQDESATRNDRAVAVGAIVTGVLAAIGVAVGLS